MSVITPSRTDTRLSLGEVDPVQPIDPTSPFARGLEGLWLPLPHLSGGSRLYDLSSYAGHADLNSVEARHDAAVSWPGHDFDPARISYGELPRFSWLDGGTAFTVAMVFVPDVHENGRNLWRPPFCNMGFNRDNGGYQFYTWDGSTLTNIVLSEGDLGALTTGVITWTANGDMQLWIDTVKGSTANSNQPASKDDIHSLGNSENLTSDQTWDGAICATAIYRGRVWTQSDVDRFDSEARRGFPGLLRRRDQSALFVSSSTTTVTETLSVSGTLSTSLTESATATETLSTSGTGSASVTESASASESVSVGATGTPSLTESATATEALKATAQANLSVTESATATEKIKATASAALSLTENATATETLKVTAAAALSITETLGNAVQRRVSKVGRNMVELLTRSHNDAEKQ